MFERSRNFLSGLGQLMRNPNILQEYRSLSHTLDTYYKQAQLDAEQLQGKLWRTRSELDFHKQMEAEGITIGKQYFDRQLDSRRMEAFQKELADPHIELPQWKPGFNAVTGFHTAADEVHMVDLEAGSVTAAQFLRDLQHGALVPATPEQLNGSAPLPPSMPLLTDEMRRMGFTPDCLEGDSFTWTVKDNGQCVSLGGWQEVEELLARWENGELCGMLTFPWKEAQFFSDPDEYMESYRDAVDTMGPQSVYSHTFSEDPEVRKGIDDVLYGEFGIENPRGLEDYQTPPVPQGPTVAEPDLDLEF